MEKKEGKSVFGYVKLASAIVLSVALVAMLVLVAIQGTSAASLHGQSNNRAMKSSAEVSSGAEIEQSALLLTDNDSGSSDSSGNSNSQDNSGNQSAPNGSMPSGPMGQDGSSSNAPDMGPNGAPGMNQDGNSDSDSNSGNSDSQGNSDSGDFWNNGGNSGNGSSNNGSNGNDFWNNNGQGNQNGGPGSNNGSVPDFGNNSNGPEGMVSADKGADGMTIAEAVIAIIMMLAGAAYALADTLQMRTAESRRMRKAVKPSAIVTGILAVVAVVFTVIWAAGLLTISAFIMLAICLALGFIAMPLLVKGIVEACANANSSDGAPVAPEGAQTVDCQPTQPLNVDVSNVENVSADVPAEEPSEVTAAEGQDPDLTQRL